jgi:hypothetical protein
MLLPDSPSCRKLAPAPSLAILETTHTYCTLYKQVKDNISTLGSSWRRKLHFNRRTNMEETELLQKYKLEETELAPIEVKTQRKLKSNKGI